MDRFGIVPDSYIRVEGVGHTVLPSVVRIHLNFESVLLTVLSHLKLRHNSRVKVVNVSVFLESTITLVGQKSAPNFLFLLIDHTCYVMPHLILVTVLVVKVLHGVISDLPVFAVEWIAS